MKTHIHRRGHTLRGPGRQERRRTATLQPRRASLGGFVETPAAEPYPGKADSAGLGQGLRISMSVKCPIVAGAQGMLREPLA